VQWYDAGKGGFYADFRRRQPFPELGFNIGMCLPGQVGALYHRESHQECRRVGENDILYPVDETAAKHGASAERETKDPREAYSSFPVPVPVPFREEFLGG
jgi:hypothetical protein